MGSIQSEQNITNERAAIPQAPERERIRRASSKIHVLSFGRGVIFTELLWVRMVWGLFTLDMFYIILFYAIYIYTYTCIFISIHINHDNNKHDNVIIIMIIILIMNNLSAPSKVWPLPVRQGRDLQLVGRTPEPGTMI